MTAGTSAATGSAARELVITRAFDAPRPLVFKTWTRPEHLVRWWGPRGYTTPSCKMDVRPGGSWRLCMRSPEGTLHWLQCVYREVVEPERLAFTWAWEDDGRRARPRDAGDGELRRAERQDEARRAPGRLRVRHGARPAPRGLERRPGQSRGVSGESRSGEREVLMCSQQSTTACSQLQTDNSPPATDDEVRASALQFVRKLSGFTRPSQANQPLSTGRWTRSPERLISCSIRW